MGMHDKAVDKTREAISEASEQVEEAKQKINEMVETARDRADKASKSAAKAAWAAGIALILGALLAMGGGWLGASHAPNAPHIEASYLIDTTRSPE